CAIFLFVYARRREIPPLSLHDALPIYPDETTLAVYAWDGPYSGATKMGRLRNTGYQQARFNLDTMIEAGLQTPVIWIDVEPVPLDRKSTRLNSSHVSSSYAVFCLNKKK